MSYIKFENKKYEMTNEIKGEQIRVDKSANLIQVYGLSASKVACSMPEFLSVISKVDCKDFNDEFVLKLAEPIVRLKKDNKKANASFRHDSADFENAVRDVFRLKHKEAQMNSDVEKTVAPLAAATTQAENTPIKERKVILVQKIQ